MNVRLVAYRKATSGATSTTAYNLDLQEAPNISLNFQFSEVKEPETRKGSYSQTFKLPFTDNNNQFFQDWYNVNLDTLVFNTRTTFDAVLYVGTVPQFEGALQLKSVYQKAQVYEVVLMSNTASLFSTIGEQRLKDVFKNDNGSYSSDFNHTYNYTNATNNTLYNSWGNSLVNTSGTSLYDSDAGVSKIVYPLSVTREGFYFSGLGAYLNMTSSDISSLGFEAASQLSVLFTQFRPAIQLKALFNLILAKAGFSYTSSFIDGSYFGKLFMTTGTALEGSAVPTTNSNNNPSGLMNVATDDEFGEFTATNDDCQSSPETVIPCDITTPSGGLAIPTDPEGMWNSTNYYFTKEGTEMYSVDVRHAFKWDNVAACNQSGVLLAYRVRQWDTDPASPTYNSLTEQVYSAIGGTTLVNSDTPDGIYIAEKTLDISNMPTGASACVTIEVLNWKRADSGSNGIVTLGDSATAWAFTASVAINWVAYSTNIYGSTVDVPACIDPEITQRAFLKDIIQRFNLVVLTNPDDDTNLIIEPYNDFIASGELKYWTDKVDTDKEIIIRDTTEIQKKTINLSDKEDNDLWNKAIKERLPEVNVFGHLKIENFNNDFATGEFKNEPLFSPFINDRVYASPNTSGTFLPNMTVQYEYTFEESGGEATNPIKKTNPKLFYYCGTATTVLDSNGDTATYNLHSPLPTAETLNAYTFTTYPVCTPFDITPSSNVYSLTASNKSLYWNSTTPICSDLNIFNNTGNSGNWFNNTLYGGYWKQYLDNIYSSEARIMECYLNLNEVDIFNFSFADEIFIKDSYWRILNISNYQVGAKASTKVTLIKSLDTKANCNGCDYVIGATSAGTNMVATNIADTGAYVWCPEDDPSCSPDITTPNYLGLYTSPECCVCNGGAVQWQYTGQASNGLYPCFAYSGSTPSVLVNKQGIRSLFTNTQMKSLVFNLISADKPFVIGSADNKYSTPLIPYSKDDSVIKYETTKTTIPTIEGEAHRIVLIGYTIANTRAYAYPQGNDNNISIKMPTNSNTIIRVKGITTVVGGTNSTYSLGYTEGFAYYTAFKNVAGTTTQLSTAGGQQEFSIREGANPTTCTLYIDVNDGVLRFGLDDNQTDTKRIWTLTVDMDVNRVDNMTARYDENWALYQNGNRIQLQNGEYLLWN
tara:strand:- start:1860 stop:5324 length:3465 start_codon:yes stop_codon:yes gene_type:complete